MHYFKKNIGDYAKKAGKLSMLEHGAYTLLMDACYDRERFPTEAEAIDWCWARTQAEEDAVRFVLRKFFTLDGDLYTQARIAEEIATYHRNAKTNHRIAMEREEKRRNGKPSVDKDARSVHEAPPETHEPPPNQEPLTNNQEPKKKSRRAASAFPVPVGVEQQTWDDFLVIRKAKNSPITETALDGIRTQAGLAGFTLQQALAECCTRGWQGFKAVWMERDRATAGFAGGVGGVVAPNRQEAQEARNRKVADDWAAGGQS